MTPQSKFVPEVSITIDSPGLLATPLVSLLTKLLKEVNCTVQINEHDINVTNPEGASVGEAYREIPTTPFLTLKQNFLASLPDPALGVVIHVNRLPWD